MCSGMVMIPISYHCKPSIKTRTLCHLSFQFLDSPVWFAVLSSWFASELFPDDGTPPGPEHHGLPAVALGAQQRHDHQPGPRHEKQPLHFGSAGTHKAQTQTHIHRRQSYQLSVK